MTIKHLSILSPSRLLHLTPLANVNCESRTLRVKFKKEERELEEGQDYTHLREPLGDMEY